MADQSEQLAPVRLGVIGLGRGFMLTLPALIEDQRFTLVAAVTTNDAKKKAFETQFDAPVYADFAQLCADPSVDAIYIATPHATHFDLVMTALQANKHVLVEKPLTINAAQAEAIYQQTKICAQKVIVGPSHSFDTPITETARLIASGKFGPVGMINASYYTDFVFRPRRKAELSAEQGGGAIFNQGVHHIDILTTLANSVPTGVYGRVGDFDERRACDGAYSAMIEFANGCFGAITYSGYGHYDGDAEVGWVSELGRPKNPNNYGNARRNLLQIDEDDAKEKRGYAQSMDVDAPPAFHEHFGSILVSCQKADLKPTPKGIQVYADDREDFLPLPLAGEHPRRPVLDELYALVKQDIAPTHSALRGWRNVAVCEAIYSSSRTNARVAIDIPEEAAG